MRKFKINSNCIVEDVSGELYKVGEVDLEITSLNSKILLLEAQYNTACADLNYKIHSLDCVTKHNQILTGAVILLGAILLVVLLIKI